MNGVISHKECPPGINSKLEYSDMIYTVCVPLWFTAPRTKCNVRRDLPACGGNSAVLTVEGPEDKIRALMASIVATLDGRRRSKGPSLYYSVSDINTDGAHEVYTHIQGALARTGEVGSKHLTFRFGRLWTSDRKFNGRLPEVSVLRQGAGKTTTFEGSLSSDEFMILSNRVTNTGRMVGSETYNCVRVADTDRSCIALAKVYGKGRVAVAGMPLSHLRTDFVQDDPHCLGIRLSVTSEQPSPLKRETVRRVAAHHVEYGHSDMGRFLCLETGPVVREEVVFKDDDAPWSVKFTTDYGCGFVRRFVATELEVAHGSAEISRATFCALLRVTAYLATGK